MGLKLLLLHVVEEGFDGIAWADGELQTSRYRTGISAVQRIYNESIPRTLLRLSAKWAGKISTSEQVAKVAWFRIEAVRPNKTVTAKHDYVRPLKCYQQAVVSIMEHYCREEILTTPTFILPEGMVEYIKNTGLPLFGEKILFAN